ncbi:MAG: type III polyketide synthase [Proteobacteria bacterium]|nr:MAG: type III polyketide synthase [Pseudomonadota bacterium]
MRIVAVGRALPKHYYDQDTLLAAFREVWGDHFHNPARLEQIFSNVLVGGRHLALPLQRYRALSSFTESNTAFIQCATELGARALQDAAAIAHLKLDDLAQLILVSSTGIATPSVDAKLVNRLGLRTDIRRTPIFGLGCMGGAGGLSRLADLLRANPTQAGALLSVELCSLTLQRDDVSVANLISSGLFGDGAACAVLVGPKHPMAARGDAGPEIVATRSSFYPDTEGVMGWDITAEGFKVVLSADVPKMVLEHVRRDVEAFLADHSLTLRDVVSHVYHPGGPRVLEAFQEALGLPRRALQLSYDSLLERGNLSSASVLLILRDVLEGKGSWLVPDGTLRANCRPAPGDYGLMLAMGPGFCTELLLLRW